MSTIASGSTQVLIPSSPQEAVQAFGDGADLTVVAGGTIVLPDIAEGRLRPERALLLSRAGLDGIRKEKGRVAIGATVAVAALESLPEPIGGAARGVGDYEIRAQATVGGNICAAPGRESPRGDLQTALLALDARVRSAGPGGERTEGIDEFFASRDGRLVLEIEFEEPSRGVYEVLGRPHAHTFTIMAVACAETSKGLRIAVGGAGPRPVRLTAVEQALAGGAEPSGAAQEVSTDVQAHDDALASAWYRTKMLPVLVERALDRL